MLGGVLGVLPMGAGADEVGAGLDPAACHDGGPAQVVALSGRASAVGRDGGERPLACGDLLRACERIVTGPDGRVALLGGDVFTQVDTDSRLQVGYTSGGLPARHLERGHIRVIDDRGGSAAVFLGTPYAEGRAARGDVNVVIQSQGGSERALVCSRAGEIALGLPGAEVAATAGAGQCLGAPSASGVASMSHSPAPIEWAADSCGSVDVAGLFNPFEVAVGPPAGALLPFDQYGLDRVCPDLIACSGDPDALPSLPTDGGSGDGPTRVVPQDPVGIPDPGIGG